MNVLFIGGWDVMGACLADRLGREGHEIAWMTEEPEKDLWDKRLKGRVYRGAFHRRVLRRVLGSNAVDTVVFMTGDLRETFSPEAGFESCLPCLTRVLETLRGRKLKSFVFLSSVWLASPETPSPAFTDLAAGELYCRTYRDSFGLPLICLRLGLLYDVSGRQGYTAAALRAISSGGAVDCPFLPGGLTDALNAPDAAMALYRLLELGLTGDYTLTTGHPIAWQDYYRLLGSAADACPQIQYLAHGHGPGAQGFDARELKQATGWIPLCLLQEKGVDLLRQSLAAGTKPAARAARPSRVRALRAWLAGPGVRRLADTLGLFAVACVLLRFAGGVGDLKYVDVRMMFVAIVACRYGAQTGIFAVALACLSYLYSLATSYVDASYLLYSVDTWVPFVVYSITGAAVGYTADRQRENARAWQQGHALLSEKYEFLKSIQSETLQTNRRLRAQILNSRHSFSDIYHAVLELDSLEPALLLLRILSLIEQVMGCGKAAVWVCGRGAGRYARLAVCSTALWDTLPNSMDLDGYAPMLHAFERDRFFANTGLRPAWPDCAAPVYEGGRLYGFVAVYDMGAEHFTLYDQNILRVLTSLLEKSLTKALASQRAVYDTQCLPNTRLLCASAFCAQRDIISSKTEGAAYRFALAHVRPREPMGLEQLSAAVASLIRESDCMGVDETGACTVLLLGSVPAQLDGLRRRFQKRGLLLEVER